MLNNKRSHDDGIKIRYLNIQACFPDIKTILAASLMLLPLLTYAVERPVKDLLKDSGITLEEYQRLIFEPEADNKPHIIGREEIAEIKKRHKQAKISGETFFAPELAVTVRNMKKHLVSLREQNVLSHEWDLSDFEQKLIDLESDGYPYKTTLITCYQFTQVVEFIYNISFHQKVALLSEREPYFESERLCFFNSAIKVGAMRVNSFYAYTAYLDMRLQEIISHDFSIPDSWLTRDHHRLNDSSIAPHNILLDALDNTDIFLFPTYEVLSRQDFLRILAGRDVFFLGMLPGPVSFHDNGFMSHGSFMEHDLLHLMLILNLLHQRQSTRRLHGSCSFYPWDTFSQYNRQPLILREGVDKQSLRAFNEYMYDAIDTAFKQLNMPPEVVSAYELIHFDILHENPLPYNALLEFSAEDFIVIISYIKKEQEDFVYGDGTCSEYQWICIIAAAEKIREIRNSLLQRWSAEGWPEISAPLRPANWELRVNKR